MFVHVVDQHLPTVSVFILHFELFIEDVNVIALLQKSLSLYESDFDTRTLYQKRKIIYYNGT